MAYINPRQNTKVFACINIDNRSASVYEIFRTNDLVPADKAANNVVVVGRLYYIQILKQELNGTKACKEVSAEEDSVVNDHCSHLPLKFSVSFGRVKICLKP